MYAQVTLNVKHTGNAIVVPIQAVDTSALQPTLLVVNTQSRVERRAVQTGVATANRIEILSGLREGELVIVANQSSFQPGELVTAKQSAMAAAGAANDATGGQ
jgi:Cu(I)/Ag(I) efflux system membrane fusion protein/cobalt-zinc-cadmium efflux system membrane fusion protein